MENRSNFYPFVSIIIPVYNGSNYMKEAIDSALSQTYSNVEVIVINDGSKDDGKTDEIARSYGDKIRYIQKENGGVSQALNVGIKNMRGEYFSWLSHDDVYMPDKLEKSVSALADIRNKKTIISCQSLYIDKDSKLFKAHRNTHLLGKQRSFTWEEALLMLQKQGPFNGCSLLIHRDILFECGLFDETLRFNQDGFMWNKIFLKKYPLICIPDVCVKNRIHDKQLTQTGQSIFRKDCEKMSHYMIPELVKISTRKKNFLLEYIKYNAKYGNKEVVKRAFLEAKREKLLTVKSRFFIWVISSYGCIRPFARKIYYLFVRRIKTT